eukprot:1169866-Amphidinium_carterae.1
MSSIGPAEKRRGWPKQKQRIQVLTMLRVRLDSVTKLEQRIHVLTVASSSTGLRHHCFGKARAVHQCPDYIATTSTGLSEKKLERTRSLESLQ